MELSPIDESLGGQPLDTLIRERYPDFETQLGLTKTYLHYASEAFGSSVVVYTSPSVRLRLINDRGSVTADLASTEEPDIWWPLSGLIRLLHVPRTDPLITLDEIVAMLQANFHDLTRLAGPEAEQLRQNAGCRSEFWNPHRVYAPVQWNPRPDAPGDGWFKRLLNRFRL